MALYSELAAGRESATVTHEKINPEVQWRQGGLQGCPDGAVGPWSWWLTGQVAYPFSSVRG